MIKIHFVLNLEIERRGGGTSLFVTVNAETLGAHVRPQDLFDVVRITVIVKDHRTVFGEIAIYFFLPLAFGSLRVIAQIECREFGNIHVTQLHFGHEFFTKFHGEQSFLRHVVTGGSKHHVRIFCAFAATHPFPNSHPVFGLFSSFFEREPLRNVPLSGHNRTNEISLFIDFFERHQKTVGIRRIINLAKLTVLFQNVADKAGILMRITVVILSPTHTREQIYQRRNGLAPFHLETLFQKFRILIEHARDNGEEGFVAWEKSKTTRESVAHHPSLQTVLRKNFHHAGTHLHVLVIFLQGPQKITAGRFKNGTEQVGLQFIRTENTEIFRIQFYKIAQKLRSHFGAAR